MNKRGQKLFVKCGYCPACLQEKALARTNKIINHSAGLADSRVRLFITLTYRNESIPYIRKDDLIKSPFLLNEDFKGFKKGTNVVEVPVYRDSYLNHSGELVYGTRIIDSVLLDYNLINLSELRPLRCQHDLNKVSICFYKDVQDFFKRLRQTAIRDQHFCPISFYACTEYGPTSVRGHIHALVDVPSSQVNYWKTAICQAWPFADNYRTSANIKIAKKAASYVASYVNCSSSVPLLLQKSNFTRPSHSSSKGYGLGNSNFSLSKIIEMFRKRDFRQNVLMSVAGVPTARTILIPKYVMFRYFRKFKGYCDLASDKIISICERPSRLSNYARQLGYDFSKNDLHRNFVALVNMRNHFIDDCPSDMSYYERFQLFGEMYSQVWTIYYSNIMDDFYNSIDVPLSNFNAYDNIKDFYSSDIRNESLEDLFLSVPTGFKMEFDANNFEANVSQTNRLTQAFNSYSKDRKVRNYIYSEIYKDN